MARFTKTQMNAVYETVSILHQIGKGELADDVESAVRLENLEGVRAPQYGPEW